MTEITAQAVMESLDVLYAAGLLTDAEVAARSFAPLGFPETQPVDEQVEAGPFTPPSVTNSLTRDDVKAVANEQIVKWHELGGSLLGLKRGDAGLEIANRLHDEGFRSAGIEVKRSKVVVELEESEGLDKFSADREVLGNLGQGGVVHNSSPSADDAGAHSVGDGPGAGDASATPATEVTLDEPFIDARYDRLTNCIILSCDGSDFAALDRDTGFLAIDRIERALQVQAKLGGVA